MATLSSTGHVELPWTEPLPTFQPVGTLLAQGLTLPILFYSQHPRLGWDGAVPRILRLPSSRAGMGRRGEAMEQCRGHCPPQRSWGIGPPLLGVGGLPRRQRARSILALSPAYAVRSVLRSGE